jgi:putative inorganic carbon (hco3(-)) transporter
MLERVLRVLPAGLLLSALAGLFFVDFVFVLAGLAALLILAAGFFLRSSLLVLILLLPTSRVGVGLPGLLGVGVFDFYVVLFGTLFLWRVVVVDLLETERDGIIMLALLMMVSFLPSLTNAVDSGWAMRAFAQLFVSILLMAGVYDGMRRINSTTFVITLFVILWLATAGIAIGSLYQTMRIPSVLALVGGRTSNPLISDPNYFAAYLVMMLCVGIALATLDKKPLRRWLHIAVIGLVLVNIILSVSRSGYLATTVIVLGWGVYFYKRFNARRAVGIIALVVVVIGAFIGIAASMGSGVVNVVSIGDRLETAASGRDKSVNQRQNILVVGTRLVRHAPVFGVGFGNFEKTFDRFREGELSTGNARAAHNSWLKILAECGVFGAFFALLFYLGLLWRVFSTALRARRPRESIVLFSIALALLSFVLMGITLDQIFEPQFWVFAGMGLAFAQQVRDDEEGMPRSAVPAPTDAG